MPQDDHYVKRLLKAWLCDKALAAINTFGTVADLALWVYARDWGPSPRVLLATLAATFLVAIYRLDQEGGDTILALQTRLAEFENTRARIALRSLGAPSFSLSLKSGRPDNPFPSVPHIKQSAAGWTNIHDSPAWASLWIHVGIRNSGGEAGTLVYSLDETQSSFPSPFDARTESPRVFFEGEHRIGAREYQRQVWFQVYVLLDQLPPAQLASALEASQEAGEQYKVVISYFTRTADGDSHRQNLPIEGDFRPLIEEMREAGLLSEPRDDDVHP